MSDRVVYHVVPEGDDWKIKREGAQRASAIVEKKSEAVNTAKTLAKNSGPLSQVKIHDQKGKIQTEYTYGKDPRKTKG